MTDQATDQHKACSRSYLTLASRLPSSLWAPTCHTTETSSHLRLSQLANGHTIQSHTLSHADLTSLTLENAYLELTKTNKTFREATCIQPTLVRPPYGAINSDVQQLLNRAGMRAVMWNLDTEDWRLAETQGHFS